MRFSRAASYAIHALVFLASRKDGQPAVSHDIARDRGTPERYLLKILNPLARVGILTSMKGPNGGYGLARPASEISLLEIIEAVEGTIRPALAFDDAIGADALQTRILAICTRATEEQRKTLGKISLADLARKGK